MMIRSITCRLSLVSKVFSDEDISMPWLDSPVSMGAKCLN